VPRYLPEMMWSVEMSSPKTHAWPRKCVCIAPQKRGAEIRLLAGNYM